MDDGDDSATDNPTNLLNKSAQFNKMAVDFYFEKVMQFSTFSLNVTVLQNRIGL